MRRLASLLLGALCVLALTFGVTAASGAQSRTWANDFEHQGDATPSGDWWTDPPATSVRTPSGAAATYASGILSAHGHWHVRMRPNMACPKSPAGPACFGSYTYFGKNGSSSNPTFPSGGYVTSIDIYLDVPWMAQDPATRFDTRFDWDSAINDASGSFRRDFVFNAGTPLTPTETASSPGYYVNASTNANRSGAFPENPCPSPFTPPNSCRAPVKITESGWYTFQHYFHQVVIGGITYLAVDMSILRQNGSAVASWTIYDQQDVRGFGGDAYGWFVINEIQDLAADCVAIHRPEDGHPPLRTICKFGPRGHEGEECSENDDSHHAEQSELDSMNAQRSAVGLPALTLNTSSSKAAREHSCDEWHGGDRAGEKGSDGSMAPARLSAAGVPFLVSAENNGLADSETAGDALATINSDLLDSVISKANILNPAFTQVGIGAVYQDGEMYLTADFTG